jgi:hypothetical protein
MKKITPILIIALSFSSCFNNYFKVKTETELKEDQLKQLSTSEKKIIVHFRNAMKLLTNPVFGPDQISGGLETYYAMANRYTNPDTEKHDNFKYKHKYRNILFSEIHIYVNEDYSGQNTYAITNQNFIKTNIYSHNKGMSIFSHALGAAIIVGMATLIATADVYAGGGFNCPQTYVEVRPGQYQFLGGLFTGAVRQDLQRTDMMSLPNLPTSDTIRIQIKGMANETQYLDFAEVRQVVHPEGTEVVGNHHGDLFIIRHLKMPNEIITGETVDRSKSLLFRDGQSYGFHVADSSDQSNIRLKFARKEGDKKAVLVARLKNSAWGGYITNELKRSYADPLAMEAGYPSTVANASMKISIMTKKGWKSVDHFPSVGNTSTRDLAMEIDLSEVEGKDVVVKIEAPYRFWDLDHVGLSYEIVKPSDVSRLCRVSATVEGKNFSSSIDRQDGLYLALESTDHVELEYIKQPSYTPGTITSYLLVAGGYYHLKPQNNVTQTQPLRFSESTTLNKYSIAKYKELGFQY